MMTTTLNPTEYNKKMAHLSESARAALESAGMKVEFVGLLADGSGFFVEAEFEATCEAVEEWAEENGYTTKSRIFDCDCGWVSTFKSAK